MWSGSRNSNNIQNYVNSSTDSRSKEEIIIPFTPHLLGHTNITTPIFVFLRRGLTSVKGSELSRRPSKQNGALAL